MYSLRNPPARSCVPYQGAPAAQVGQRRATAGADACGTSLVQSSMATYAVAGRRRRAGLRRRRGHAAHDGAPVASKGTDAIFSPHQLSGSGSGCGCCGGGGRRRCPMAPWMQQKAKFQLTTKAMSALVDSLGGLQCGAQGPCRGSADWCDHAPCAAIQAENWFLWRQHCQSCRCASKDRCCCPRNRACVPQGDPCDSCRDPCCHK